MLGDRIDDQGDEAATNVSGCCGTPVIARGTLGKSYRVRRTRRRTCWSTVRGAEADTIRFSNASGRPGALPASDRLGAFWPAVPAIADDEALLTLDRKKTPASTRRAPRGSAAGREPHPQAQT